MGLTECAHDPFSDEVKGVIVMSEGGLKMYSKYYSADLAGASPQRLAELEKAIFEKTKGLTSARLESASLHAACTRV